MSIILDTNNQKIHMEWCKELREKVDSKHRKKISSKKEIPENYTKCEECTQEEDYDDTKWGSLV